MTTTEILHYAENKLYLDHLDLSQVTDHLRTPAVVYASHQCKQNLQNYHGDVAGHIGGPFRFFYPVRNSPTLAMIGMMHQHHLGMECSSANEIERALRSGVAASSIVMVGLAKTREDLTLAIQSKVGLLVVETEAELALVIEIATALGLRPAIALRVMLDLESTQAKRQTIRRDQVFYGVEWSKVRKFYQEIRTSGAIDLKGLSCHMGSDAMDMMTFQLGCKRLMILVEMLREYGGSIDTIHWGGGFDNSYLKSREEFGHMMAAMGRHLGSLGCHFYLTPSSLLFKDATYILARIISVKLQAQRHVVMLDLGSLSRGFQELEDSDVQVFPLIHEDGRRDRIELVIRSGGLPYLLSKKNMLRKPTAGQWILLSGLNELPAYLMDSVSRSDPPFTEIMVQGDRWHSIVTPSSLEEQLSRESIPAWA